MHSDNPAAHGPNRLSSFLHIHDAILNKFAAHGFVGQQQYEATPFMDFVWMSGWIHCRGRIVIQYDKKLVVVDELAGEPLVQTEMYTYNASVQNGHNIVRYDNQHPEYLRPGHADPHHKHVFDFKSGDEMPESPLWLGAAKWPHLGDVISELEQWHSDHYNELESPDDYASAPQRQTP